MLVSIEITSDMNLSLFEFELKVYLYSRDKLEKAPSHFLVQIGPERINELLYLHMRAEVAVLGAEPCRFVDALGEGHQNLSSLRIEIGLQTGTSVIISFRISFCTIIVAVRRVALVLVIAFGIVIPIFVCNWYLNLTCVSGCARIVPLHESGRLN